MLTLFLFYISLSTVPDMAETDDKQVEIVPQKNRALPVFIVLFVLSLGLSLFLFFKYVKHGVKLQQQHEELTMLYELTHLHADSLEIELDHTQKELDTKYNEILALEDIKESLRSELDAKKVELANAQARVRNLIAQSRSGGGNNTDLINARRELDSLRSSNLQYINELRSSKAANTMSQERLARYAESNDSLVTLNTILKNKLKAASDLTIADLKVEPVRDKKGTLEVTEKASKIERLRIKFTVLGNDLTQREDKEIIVRVLTPSGVVLAKNTNTLTDSDKLYTMVIPFEYDGEDKRMVYYYDHDASYPEGKFTLELYHNNDLLDRNSFSLR